MPKGQVTPLADRAFSRTVGGGKAKVVIPKAIFNELVAAVAAKPGAGAVPESKKGSGIPPVALVFAGLALSGACLYALAKAPRYRTVAATTAVAIVAVLAVMSTRQADANAGPIRPRDEGQIIIEVPADGDQVVIYVSEPETRRVPVDPSK